MSDGGVVEVSRREVAKAKAAASIVPGQLLYTAEQAALVLGTSRAKFDAWYATGLFPRARDGRKSVLYHRDTLEKVATLVARGVLE